MVHLVDVLGRGVKCRLRARPFLLLVGVVSGGVLQLVYVQRIIVAILDPLHQRALPHPGVVGIGGPLSPPAELLRHAHMRLHHHDGRRDARLELLRELCERGLDEDVLMAPLQLNQICLSLGHGLPPLLARALFACCRSRGCARGELPPLRWPVYPSLLEVVEAIIVVADGEGAADADGGAIGRIYRGLQRVGVGLQGSHRFRHRR